MAEGRHAALTVEGVSKRFGAVRPDQAGQRSGIDIEADVLHRVHGAGKSTLLHCISGFLSAETGRVLLDERDISRWAPHRRARAGLGTVFQVMQAPHLDVLSAVMVGAHTWTRTGFVEAVVRPPWQWAEERRIREEAERALELVGLAERAADPADALPLGQLRLLSVARVLAQRPQVLLLDEPAAGLRAAEKAQLRSVLADLRERGLTQVLVEHDMQFVGAVAERIIVLDRGRVIADGAPADVRSDGRVIEAYLGTAKIG